MVLLQAVTIGTTCKQRPAREFAVSACHTSASMPQDAGQVNGHHRQTVLNPAIICLVLVQIDCVVTTAEDGVNSAPGHITT